VRKTNPIPANHTVDIGFERCRNADAKSLEIFKSVILHHVSSRKLGREEDGVAGQQRGSEAMRT
jgi:hypothetical protein